jgi:hypothetical protein
LKATFATALILAGLTLAGCGPAPKLKREDLLVGTWACEMKREGWRNTATLDFRSDRTGVVTMHARGATKGVRGDLKVSLETRWELRNDKWLANEFQSTNVFWAKTNGVPAGERSGDMIRDQLDQFLNMRMGEVVELEAGHMVLKRNGDLADCTRSA